MLSGLMVDDEPLVGRSLVRYLKPRGVELDFVSDPDRFWQKARGGTHRVIALDELLGWDRGSAICAKLRARGERRAILLTSHALTEGEGAACARDCGADEFVLKTATRIREAFEKLGHLDPSRAPPLTKCRTASYRHAFREDRVVVDDKRVVFERIAVELTPREHDTFLYLLRRAPRVVTVLELQHEIWRAARPSRSAISNVVGQLIRRLPEDWIERVDGGYRAKIWS